MSPLEEWQYAWFCYGLSLMGMKVVHIINIDGTPGWEVRSVY